MMFTDASIEYLTKKDVCQLYRISLRSLNYLIADDAQGIPLVRMKAFKGGRYRVLFEKQAIDAWFKARVRATTHWGKRNGAVQKG